MATYFDHPIVGTWQLISFTEKTLETGAVSYPFGESARAIVIYTPDGYAATIFTRQDRRTPAGPHVTDSEATDLYRSMIAFAGRYEVDVSKLIYYRPEISWNEAWNGTMQERLIENHWRPSRNYFSSGDKAGNGREDGLLSNLGARIVKAFRAPSSESDRTALDEARNHATSRLGTATPA